jgi:NAD(P)-dependent dehydrogenase (short-subunit alcohol dehydrogenase family)
MLWWYRIIPYRSYVKGRKISPSPLAREGAKVVVTDVDGAGGQVVDKIGSAGGEAIFLHQDVTLEETWPGIIEATEPRFGRLERARHHH